MPIDCRVPTTHPDWPELLRRLAEFAIRDDTNIRIAASADSDLGWELTVATAARVSACCVPTNEGPMGILVAVWKLLARRVGDRGRRLRLATLDGEHPARLQCATLQTRG